MRITAQRSTTEKKFLFFSRREKITIFWRVIRIEVFFHEKSIAIVLKYCKMLSLEMAKVSLLK